MKNFKRKLSITAVIVKLILVALIVAPIVLLAGCGGGGGGAAVAPAAVVTIAPEARFALSGTVTATNGITALVSGARVSLSATATVETTTSPSGVYSFGNLQGGNYTLVISPNRVDGGSSVPRFATVTQAFQLNATQTINIPVTHIFDLSGIVQDTGGTVVRGANITLAVTGSSPWEYYTMTTGTDGAFQFNEVLGGRDYTIVISNPGSTSMVPRLAIETEGITIAALDRNTSGLTITGVVPACFTDADCASVMPMGMTVAQCRVDDPFTPGTAISACRYQ